MENETVHLLWVSSTPSVPAVVQQFARQAQVRVSQAAPYDAAIHSVQCERPDAVFLMADFDSLTVLEFIHHARLLNGQVPIVVLCKEYDAGLDYKARKLGATDCVTLAEVDGPFLGGLVKKGQSGAHTVRRSARIGKTILQIPVWFK